MSSFVGLTIALAALFVATALPMVSNAHEVRPSVADVEISDKDVVLSIRMNLDAILVGVNLNGLADTNDSDLAGDYDALRGLDAEHLRRRAYDDWDKIAPFIRISSGGTLLETTLVAVQVEDPGDPGLARDSIVTLQAMLPEGDGDVVVGWDESFGDLVIRQVGAGDDAYTGYLRDGQDSEPMPRTGFVTESTLRAFGRYISVGFEHIVPKGLDHILFVLGLFLLSTALRPLLFQVTAFTIAHSVSLALAVLGIVSVPSSIVEPLIAASIVFVGIENLTSAKMHRWRPLIVFCFGLLHGLGFASVLGEIGLDPTRFIVGLVGFNLGVEFGQLAVITVAFLAVGLWFRNKPWYRARITNPASLAISIIAAYWFFERIGWLGA